jgi:hypothetical protein
MVNNGDRMEWIKGIAIAIGVFIFMIVMTVLSVIAVIVKWVLVMIGFPILIAIAYINRDK